MELKNGEGEKLRGIEMHRGGREVEVGERERGEGEEVDGKKRDGIDLN